MDNSDNQGRILASETAILTAALSKIIELRESSIDDASQNLIYRDADHYFAARVQEYRFRNGEQVAAKARNAGLSDTAANSLGIWWNKEISKEPSRENNQQAYRISEVYETMKLLGFQKEISTGQSNVVSSGRNAPSAAGGTEWALLGMIDYERYDVDHEKQVSIPHYVVDLPGTGQQYANVESLPSYLREAAKATANKIGYAKLTE